MKQLYFSFYRYDSLISSTMVKKNTYGFIADCNNLEKLISELQWEMLGLF